MDEQQPVPLTKPAPAAEPALRASDADRDRIAEILREALAEGRLTPEEHAERIDAVYQAKTVGDLEPLVRDLPAGAAAGQEAPARPAADRNPSPSSPERTLPDSDSLVAIFGGATRKGHWRARPHTNALAVFGGIEIDLTEAIFEQRETVSNVTAIFGGVEIKVPENVSLRGTGAGILGGFDVKSYEAPDPDAPVIVVTGFALFGGVEAKPKRGKRLKNLRA